MSEATVSSISGKKWVLAGVGILVLLALWWAFRPEKLWINTKVSEPAPFTASADPQPLFTGTFAGRAHPTSGRASLYSDSQGKRELRLTDFNTSNGPDVRVVLVQSTDEHLKETFVKGDLKSIELGPLKANQGDQNYEVPDSTDLSSYDTAVIYCVRFRVIFGVAKLEKF